jgi:putative hydrolase of the HAD superfamily
MTKITAIFWDVGGVLLTNGWDRGARRKLLETFKLEGEDFEERHEAIVAAFETGKLSLDQYLEQTIFWRKRDFSKEDVKSFIFAQSQPYPEGLAIVERLARAQKYLLATLNNESLELNRYRVERFGLRKHFTVFLTSCFLGVRKPDQEIYKLALGITQRAPEESAFVDDRRLNVECAARVGMRAIQYKNPTQLQADLTSLGVES